MLSEGLHWDMVLTRMNIGAGVFQEQVCRLWCFVRPVKHPAGLQGPAAGEQAPVAGPVASCQRLHLATWSMVQSHAACAALPVPSAAACFCPALRTASIQLCTSSRLAGGHASLSEQSGMSPLRENKPALGWQGGSPSSRPAFHRLSVPSPAAHAGAGPRSRKANTSFFPLFN